MSDLLQVELMLLNWAKTATGGAKVIFQVQPEDLAKFEPLTIAKGGHGGQRFMAALALIGDDEQPADLPVGPLCRTAVIWCRDPAFQEWLGTNFPNTWAESVGTNPIDCAKEVVCTLCGVVSRKDLDYAAEAGRMFNECIQQPYRAHLNREGAQA
jgi:hypothetical protein